MSSLTGVSLLDHAGVSDGDGGAAGTAGGALALHELHDLEALDDLAEDNVLSVEPLGLGGADEELGSVGVGTSVGHGEGSGAEVLSGLSGEGLVGELLTVDGLAAGTVTAGEVTTLDHEVRDDTVESGALVVKGLAGASDTLLTSAESAEVLGGLGAGVGEELEHDAAGGLTSDGDIEENLGVGGDDLGAGHVYLLV